MPLARSCRPPAMACVCVWQHVTLLCNPSAAGTAVFRHKLKPPLATARVRSEEPKLATFADLRSVVGE